MGRDLDPLFRAIEAHDTAARAQAKQTIRVEFARLDQLQPSLDAYKEIATRQAREIAELSIALEAFTSAPRVVELSALGIEAVGYALKRAITEYYDEMEASVDVEGMVPPFAPPPTPPARFMEEES